MKRTTQPRTPTLESLAGDYVEKVEVVTISGLENYLRCGWEKAAQIIRMMEAAAIIERSSDNEWKKGGDK